MSGHTPGPWIVAEDTLGSIESACGVSVAQSFQVRPFREDRLSLERKANARLIAAAPELLAALIAILPEAQANFYGGDDAYAKLKAAHKAIAKATGEHP